MSPQRFAATTSPLVPHSSRFLLLPFLQVLWVNTHGLFILGPCLVAAFLAGELAEGVLGKYILNVDDVVKGRKFEDGVACGSYAIRPYERVGRAYTYANLGREFDGRLRHVRVQNLAQRQSPLRPEVTDGILSMPVSD